jgi:hypothetical protein
MLIPKPYTFTPKLKMLNSAPYTLQLAPYTAPSEARTQPLILNP